MLAALKGNGIDATALGNPITGTLVATSGSTAGNALDQSLDTLNAKLASSGVTLAQLTTTLLQNRPAATPSGTPSVALEVALQPKAATCDAFRAGGGELMLMAAGEDGTWASATHVRTHTLPAVGTVGATWKLSQAISSNLLDLWLGATAVATFTAEAGVDVAGAVRATTGIVPVAGAGVGMHYAASVGYLTWQFRPVVGGIWADVADDVTLNPDGSRAGPWPGRREDRPG